MSETLDRPARAGRRLRMGGPLRLFCVVCAAACASAPPPPPEPPKVAAAPQRLGWMPLDSFDAPVVAEAINERTSRVKPAWAAESVKAAVSMEVAQLAIECIQPTADCYGAVAKSLKADRLLWAEVDPVAADEKIRITVVMFDVRAGTASRRVGTFNGVPAARAGVGDLVDGATDPNRKTQ